MSVRARDRAEAAPSGVARADSRARRVIGPWGLAAFGAAGAASLVALAFGLWVGPSVRDDVALDWVVRAVALDWRDFGHERAVARLQYELDHQGIGGQVSDDHCRLTLTPTGDREVACEWVAELRLPFAGPVRLPFSSRAVVDREGRLW
jgi:hypothetical protein